MAIPKSTPVAEYDVPSITRLAEDPWDWVLRAAIIAGLVIIFFSVAGHMFRPLWHQVDRNGWMTLLQHPSMLWMTMGILLLSFRTLLWFRYRPFTATAPDKAPALTVVIPAYNEGPMVGKTIDSVATARYPSERLEILVIDDGSRDDTWQHIQRAAARHPCLVTTLQFAENRGKRAALAAGFHRAKGDIVITIDSDCVIERSTLLAMTGPFRSPRVGAVAGKVLVHNRHDGFIPRFLHVRFLLSFDFLRAAESAYGTVYCTPGALSAYRLSVVREVLDRWLNQTFLGVRATYGEDRALTNFILEHGFDSVYQRTGVVYTLVPNTYGKLCKMFLRWDRSYIREDLRFLRILWSRPWKARLISLVDRIITNLHYPVAYAAMGMFLSQSLGRPVAILRMLLAIGLASLFYTLYCLRSERSLNFIYGVLYAYFSLFALSWIFPYAALTLRARAWMTR